MLRNVSTPYGEMTYRLERKRVKNLNLRVIGTGEIILSIPMRCSTEQADEMIYRKSEWLAEVLYQRQEEMIPLPPMPGREICRDILVQAVEAVYPLVEGQGVAMPEVKVRKMKSQWGNCHWSQGYITLNTALARCPRHLREYVALHELVHFLHHDHSPLFHQAMERRMPDWKRRRAELKRYWPALLESSK